MSKINKPLGLSDRLGFGKHNGKTVRQVLENESDVGWLLWIRYEKRKSGEPMFDDTVSALLDKVITADPKRWMKFAITKLSPLGRPIAGLTTQPDRAEQYDDSWGVF